MAKILHNLEKNELEIIRSAYIELNELMMWYKSGFKVMPTQQFTKNLAICCNTHNFHVLNNIYLHLNESIPFGRYQNLMNFLISKWIKQNVLVCSNLCLNFPVGGMDEYKKDKQENKFWENPKRIEYLKFMINELYKILNSKYIDLDE